MKYYHSCVFYLVIALKYFLEQLFKQKVKRP